MPAAPASFRKPGPRTRKVDSDRVISRRSIKALLRRDGRKDEITTAGFNLLTKVGTDTMKKLIMTAKTELAHTLGARGANVTVNTNAMKHAANCMNIPGAIVSEAISNLNNKAFSTRAMRRSATKRLVANHGGKKRSRSDVPTFLYCIAMVVLDEVISQIQASRNGRNVRIKNEHIYKVIKEDKSNLLGMPHLARMIGDGMSFV